MTDKFSLLAGIASDWWWETNADLHYTGVSERFTEVFGLPPSAVLGKRPTELDRTDYDTPKWRAHIDDLANHRAFRDYDTTLVDAKGVSRPVSTSGTPKFSVDGKFEGYLGVGHDLTELRRREKEALAHAGNLDAILQNIDQGVLLLDKALNIVTHNRRMIELMEFGADFDGRGMPFEQALRILASRGEYAPQDAEAAIAIRMQLIKSATPFSAERRRPDGRTVAVTYGPLPTGGGVMTYSDVTAIHARQERQRELADEVARERTRLVTAQAVAKVGSWETHLATPQIVCSAEGFRIFGIDPAVIPTRDTFRALVHPDDRAAVNEALERSLDTREVCAIEHRILTPDGALKYIGQRWQTYLGDDGRPSHLVGTCQDLTDLKLAEKKAEEASSLLRISGQAARLGGWVANLGEDRVVWSDVTAEIHEESHGFSPTLDKAFSYYPPEHRKTVENAFRRCAHEGVSFDHTLPLLTARGKQIWIRLIGEAVRDRDGKITSVNGAFQDISELVAARTESRRLSERLYETLDKINDAFITIDRDWRFTFVNQEGMKVLQKSDTDLLGKSIWDELPELVGSTFDHQSHRAVESQEMASFVEYYPPLAKWFNGRVYPSAEGLAIYLQDVTDTREQQAQLALLETAVSRLNDIVLITDADLIYSPEKRRIIYVNDAFVRRTGFSAKEAIGQTPRILQGPKTDRAELGRIYQALRNRQPVRGELLNYTKSGEEFWLELDSVPVVDEKGALTHWVSVARDITERKAIEQARDISEQRFRIVAQLTADVVWDWDLVAGTLWRSREGITRFGFDPNASKIKVEVWRDQLHPEDRERVVAIVDAAIKSSVTSVSDEHRLRRADGSYAQVLVRGSIIRDEEGKALRVIGSTTDVTEQRRIEEQLRQSQKLEAIGKLTGGVAHDFNNILMVIMANVDAALDEKADAVDSRKNLERIGGATERAAQLTRQLLAFSRKQMLRLQQTNLNDLVVSTGALLRRTLGAHIEIESVLAEELWLTNTDRAQVEAALVNLCINARDAMPDGGKLLIETANAKLDEDYVARHPDAAIGQYVTLAVTDTGFGMSAEVLAKAFEPFFTTKGVGKGTGLGLSMIYGFIKQSKGHIKIDSAVGRGTTVKLYLPWCAQPATPRAAKPESEPFMPSGTGRILVVEDEAQVRAIMVQQLTSLGYTVLQASNGTDGLSVLKAGPPCDLLLTDVVMPGPINGSILAHEATKIYPEMRVLFMSGYSEDAISTFGVLDPDVRLLSKPFRKTDLAQAVRRAMDGTAQ